MKLFASSQAANSNTIQDATVELSEQALNAISGGCGGTCGIHPDPITIPQGFGGGQGFGFGEGFGEGFGFREDCDFGWYPRHCHPRYRHCCR